MLVPGRLALLEGDCEYKVHRSSDTAGYGVVIQIQWYNCVIYSFMRVRCL